MRSYETEILCIIITDGKGHRKFILSSPTDAGW